MSMFALGKRFVGVSERERLPNVRSDLSRHDKLRDFGEFQAIGFHGIPKGLP